jgi:hypothetical protein
MAREVEGGLRNEELRKALREAVAGDSARLIDQLARHGPTPSGKPNLSLATAFGVELGGLPGKLEPLLSRLGREDAAPDTALVFLPIAAAHGWAACVRLGREVEAAWAALGELAADERAPVRIGTIDALMSLALREGGADELVARADAWLDLDDRDIAFGASALAIEALGDPRLLAALSGPEPLLAYLSRTIAEAADAPRAAHRYEGRRRLLTSLAKALSSVITAMRAGERGLTWFEEECARAKHPDVRLALSDTLHALRSSGHAPRTAVIDRLRDSLALSAKPLRYEAKKRPGTGRGKSSRRTR